MTNPPDDRLKTLEQIEEAYKQDGYTYADNLWLLTELRKALTVNQRLKEVAKEVYDSELIKAANESLHKKAFFVLSDLAKIEGGK